MSPCYTPSLPLTSRKWSLPGSIFIGIYTIFPVFMRLLEF